LTAQNEPDLNENKGLLCPFDAPSDKYEDSHSLHLDKKISPIENRVRPNPDCFDHFLINPINWAKGDENTIQRLDP
jgi:hypothetical protein